MELVSVKGKEVFTDSLVIAKGTGNQHESVVAIIIKYESDFKDFGHIELTDLKSGKRGCPIKMYKLNELQATLLITYLGNSDIVRKFMKELVRQFYIMRKVFQEQQSSEGKFFRSQSKIVRLAETEVLKDLVEYAKANGSKNANRFYVNYTKLANKTVGIKNIKEASIMQLNYLMLVENMFSQIIRTGINLSKDYHDIYYECKAKAIQLNSTLCIGAIA